MIKLNIKVEYVERKGDHQVFLTWEEASKGQDPATFDWWDRTERFQNFTNKGRISKPERSRYDIINKEAERQAHRIIELMQTMKADQAEANRLAEVLCNNHKLHGYFSGMAGTVSDDFDYTLHGDFDPEKHTPGWSVIKIKISHSRWYKGAGSLNAPTKYFYEVPTEVKDIALKLQGIRKKYQNVPGFDFNSCDYPKRIIRVADHDNDTGTSD